MLIMIVYSYRMHNYRQVYHSFCNNCTCVNDLLFYWMYLYVCIFCIQIKLYMFLIMQICFIRLNRKSTKNSMIPTLMLICIK